MLPAHDSIGFMLAHGSKLLLRSLVAVPSLVSNNWLGVCLFIVFVPALTIAIKWRRKGRSAVMAHWDGVRDAAVALGIGVVLLLGWSIVKNVYDDWNGNLARIKILHNENAALNARVGELSRPPIRTFAWSPIKHNEFIRPDTPSAGFNEMVVSINPSKMAADTRLRFLFGSEWAVSKVVFDKFAPITPVNLKRISKRSIEVTYPGSRPPELSFQLYIDGKGNAPKLETVSQWSASPQKESERAKVDLPCLHPLRFSVKRAQSQTAAYRKDITIEPEGARQLRIYHSTAFITSGGPIELPGGIGRLESSGPESFDVAIDDGTVAPRTITLAFVSETDFTISCVDRVQK